MHSKFSDKYIEMLRYDKSCLSNKRFVSSCKQLMCGALSVSPIFRTPYLVYENMLCKFLPLSPQVLEIGSGSGNFTNLLVESKMTILATDISFYSLEVLRSRYFRFQNLQTLQCDMECVPLPDHSFDLITCAGSLSYGDNIVVMDEIYRLLKPGGRFICVDSLNHNPLYSLNRFFHYLRGCRTMSTLIRMPTLSLIQAYELRFGNVEVEFYGSLSWLTPLFAIFIGQVLASQFSDFFDRFFRIRSSAFKFVMIAHKVL